MAVIPPVKIPIPIPKPKTRTQAGALGLLVGLVLATISIQFFFHQPSVTSTFRDPRVQPFTSTSIWNMPIGSGAVYVASKIKPPTLKALTVDQSVVIQDPTAKLTAIKQNGGQHSNTCTVTGGTLATDPIPVGLVSPASNANNEFTVLKATGGLDEGTAFARCAAGGVATAGHLGTFGTLFGNGLTGGLGGSRLSALGGLLRPGEIAPGKSGAPHALRVNIYGAANLYKTTAALCFRWPATRCDGYGPTGYGGTNPALKMGALLAIPPSFNCASLATEAGRELCWTLQNYGAYVANDSGRSVFTITAEKGDANTAAQWLIDWGFPLATAGVATTGWSGDVLHLIAALDVVNNNSSTSIGGGGTPRQPLAPPLGTAPSPTPTPISSPSGFPTPSAASSPRLSPPPTSPSPTPSPLNSPSPSPSPSASPPPPPSAPHVMVIMEENKGYSGTLGACSADPYLCSLAAAYDSQTSWWGVNHPSEPNYVAMGTGGIQGCVSDSSCTANSLSAQDFGNQLSVAGIPWVAYMESMPSPCYTGGASGGYALKHNPFGFSKDEYVGLCHILPYPGAATMVSAMDGAGGADFIWITPNLTNDMHTGTVQQGDAWLKTNLGAVLNSTWFTQFPSTVIVSMDEGDPGADAGGCCGDAVGGHIPMVIISNAAAGRGNQSTPVGSLYGMTRSIQEAYGLPFLGATANPANGDLLSLFG